MKKLFVIFGVLAMSAGVVFAQVNTADIDQHGSDHVADVIQDVAGEDNNTTVFQNGNGHMALVNQEEGVGNSVAVTQRGKENKAEIEQTFDGENLLGPSTVRTLQQGKENEIYVRQQYNRGDNLADIEQHGKENKVDMIQDNKNNETWIRQNGQNNAATLNLQRNFGGENGEGYVYLNQNGKDNTAFIDQDGRDDSGDAVVNNHVEAYQVGNGNFMDVDQLRGSSEAEDNEAYLYQTGTENVLRLEQAEAPSYAFINQEGSQNRIGGTDESFAWNMYEHGYQDASQITINQFGNKNEIGLYQENSWTDSWITQEGSANRTLLYQTDGNGLAEVYQNGSGNQANVWQSTE